MPATGAAPAPRRRRRVDRVLLWSLGGALLLVAAAVLVAALMRPRWYAPAELPPAVLREEKAAIAGLENRISAALNAAAPVRITLDEAQLNRWLMARRELAVLAPQLAAELPGLELPQVHFEAGALRIGATRRSRAGDAVVGLRIAPQVAGSRIDLHYGAARLGALPLPRGWIDRAVARLPGSEHVQTNPEAGMVSVPNEWVWPNGKRRFRLRELELRPGRCEAVLEPLR